VGVDLTRIWLIRHGAIDRTEAAGQRHDPDLTSTGRDEVTALRARLDLPTAAVRLRSPATRSATTATLLGWDDAPTSVQVEPAWAERDLGAWEGRPWAQLWDEAPAAVQTDPAAFVAFTPPQAEAVVELHARVRAALHALPYVPDVAVVTHAGPTVAAIAAVLDLSAELAMRLRVGTGTVTRITRFGDTFTVDAVGA
jgi:broad specificity phosphatase PhoE